MGVLRFRIYPPERLTDEMAGQAYLTGLDRMAWRVETCRQGDILSLSREATESASLHVPWPIERHGAVTVSTGGLLEREEPYLLPLELARGTLGQLRNQLADWQSIGLAVAQPIRTRIGEATKQLARAATCQHDIEACAQHAETSLCLSYEAAILLTATYTDQSIAVRRRGGARLAAWLGAKLGVSPLDETTASHFLGAFNAANVSIDWRDIETTEGSFDWSRCDQQVAWCHAHGLRTVAGPLVTLAPHTLPDWLALWEDDFENLLTFVEELVSTAVSRYRGKIDLWQCAGRVNTGDVLSLSEQDKLRLAARSVELVRELDPEAPAAIALDQPWAEYMSRYDADFPPLQFADALIRAGLDISGLALEINLSRSPGGTLPRSPLELSRQMDAWGSLGLPLYLHISAPSKGVNDPLAHRGFQRAPGKWSTRAQQAWITRCVPLMLAKPYVAGVFWNQLSDAEPHEFPHGGLFDNQGSPKPALETLAAMRRAHLR